MDAWREAIPKNPLYLLPLEAGVEEKLIVPLAMTPGMVRESRVALSARASVDSVIPRKAADPK